MSQNESTTFLVTDTKNLTLKLTPLEKICLGAHKRVRIVLTAGWVEPGYKWIMVCPS